jgi:hypothetical protein
MRYATTLRNKRTRNYLGKSTLYVKRSALFHLFRVHNGSGYSVGFGQQLSNLFRGFFRVLISRQPGVKGEGGNKDQPKWNSVSLILLFFFYVHN